MLDSSMKPLPSYTFVCPPALMLPVLFCVLSLPWTQLCPCLQDHRFNEFRKPGVNPCVVTLSEDCHLPDRALDYARVAFQSAEHFQTWHDFMALLPFSGTSPPPCRPWEGTPALVSLSSCRIRDISHSVSGMLRGPPASHFRRILWAGRHLSSAGHL